MVLVEHGPESGCLRVGGFIRHAISILCAESVIAVSERLAERLQSTFGAFLRSKPLRAIPNGIDTGFFAPVANVVLSSVSAREEGKASGANNAIRELGGVLGVTVLASIFAHWGGYTSGASFVAGLTPAITVGGIVVAVGAVAAASIPARRRTAVLETAVPIQEAVAV